MLNTKSGPKKKAEVSLVRSSAAVYLTFVAAGGDSEAAWKTDVWIADEPDHMIHFNGNRFPGPYPDAMPPKP